MSIFCLAFTITGQGQDVRFGHHSFRPTIFLVDVLSNVTLHKCSLPYLLFAWHTVFNNLFQMAARVYSLHSGAMLSDKSDCIVSTSKNFLSLVFVIQNYAIHIWEHTKGSLTLSGCFLLPACLWISHVSLWFVLYHWKLRNKLFLNNRIGTQPNFKYWILQLHLSVKHLGNVALVHQGVFFIRNYYLLALTEPLGNMIHVVQ